MTDLIESLELTAIDPNKYMEITEESFVNKYGEAANKLLSNIRLQAKREAYNECLESVKNTQGRVVHNGFGGRYEEPTKEDYLESITKSVKQQ